MSFNIEQKQTTSLYSIGAESNKYLCLILPVLYIYVCTSICKATAPCSASPALAGAIKPSSCIESASKVDTNADRIDFYHDFRISARFRYTVTLLTREVPPQPFILYLQIQLKELLLVACAKYLLISFSFLHAVSRIQRKHYGGMCLRFAPPFSRYCLFSG